MGIRIFLYVGQTVGFLTPSHSISSNSTTRGSLLQGPLLALGDKFLPHTLHSVFGLAILHAQYILTWFGHSTSAVVNIMGPTSFTRSRSMTDFRRRPLALLCGSLIFILYILYILNYDPFGSKPITAQQPLDEIPPKIWQTFGGRFPLSKFTPLLGRWISENPDYAYTMVSDEGANTFAHKHYANRPEVLQTFLDLRVPVFRSDLFRYMILESEGGVYSDLDTDPRKSIRDWLPAALKPHIHLIVGIEYDQLEDEAGFGVTDRIQFCQWTMAASRGHPLMKRIVSGAVDALHGLALRSNTTIAQLEPSDDEVLSVTGPRIWTRAVLDTISLATGTNMTYQNVTGMTEARLFGDILILPINAFGAGQDHSNSNRDDTADDIYVRHMWQGSWRHGWNG